MEGIQTIEHDLSQYFTPNSSTTSNFGIIILNQPLLFNSTFQKLFCRAKVKVCADGGGNRLYDGIQEYKNKNLSEEVDLHQNYLPDSIVGDLDSLRSEINQFYTLKGIQVHKISDQDSTDLQKAYSKLKAIESNLNLPSKLNLIIYGGIGGRFDHTMATVNSIFDIQMERPVLVYTPENCIVPLTNPFSSPIHHIIKFNGCEGFGRNCGIIPFFGPIKITTQGLKWDMVDQISEFGGLVSTSNYLLDDQVSVLLYPSSQKKKDGGVFTIEVLQNNK